MFRLPAPSLAASFLLLSPLLSPAAFATVRPHHHSSSHAMVRRTASTRATRSRFNDRPSFGISSDRATEIQTALIERGYLSGEPTGSWDASSAAAMQKLQSDNGWQTKIVPDSRALIKLGLGPKSASASSSPAVQSPQGPDSN